MELKNISIKLVPVVVHPVLTARIDYTQRIDVILAGNGAASRRRRKTPKKGSLEGLNIGKRQ
jgi:hypothetical protein